MPDQHPETPRTAYLPPRAAKARKLILRTQLGLAWLLAASVFALVILVAGSLFLLQGGRPGAPWVRVAAVAAVPEGSVAEVPAGAGLVVVVDRRGGLLQAFLAEPGPCPVTAAAGSAGFARSCQDEAWDADGTPRRAGAPALRRVPARLTRGDLYVDVRAATP
ncbi:MAG TPA: hypothetical protein VG276_14260 [Actinomycetes bacterium]|jgi:hypothetical protein|nr:hypothetical protein [Actinomycetes bacterium]